MFGLVNEVYHENIAVHVVTVGKTMCTREYNATDRVLWFIPVKALMDRKPNANAPLYCTLPLLKQYFLRKSCTNVVNKNTKHNKFWISGQSGYRDLRPMLFLQRLTQN